MQQLPFDELVNHATAQIHLALLEGGGKAMKSATHLWMSQAIMWRLEKDIDAVPLKKSKAGKKR